MSNLFNKYIGGGSSSSADLYSKYIGSKPKKEEEEKDTDYYNERLKKEIDNYGTRLSAVGVDADKDKRNWFEKATNLKEGQNGFFDFLELIDRPSDAIRTGLLTDLEGGSFWKGALEGFTGKKDTQGKELNKALGFDHKKDWVDSVGGFATEVIVDPLNLVGGGIAKGVGKGIGALGKAGNNTIRSLPQGNEFMEGVTKGVDTIGQAFNTRYFDPRKTKDLKDRIDAQRNHLIDKNINETKWLVDNFGVENGEKIARILENDLKIEKGTKEWVNIINNLSTKGEIALRGTNSRFDGIGKLSNLVNAMNTAARNDSKLSDTIMKQWDRQYKSQDEIKALMHKYGSQEKLITRIKMRGHDEKELLKRISKFKRVDNLEKTLKRDEHFPNGDIEIVKDLFKLQRALNIGKASKQKANELMNPIQINKLNATKPLDEMQIEEIDELRKLADNGDLAAQRQLQLMTKDRLKASDEVRKNGRKGYQITKADKTKLAVAEGVSRNLGKIIENMGVENIDIPRLQRELSQNVDDQFVAGKLQSMQNDLLDWGKAQGIDIDMMEGYMRHAITEEYQKLTYKTESTGKAGVGGNEATVKERKFFGSVEDVHEAYGKEMFESNSYKAFMKGQEKVANYIAAQSFVNKVLANPSVSKKWTPELAESLGGKLPRGKTLVTPKDFDFYKVLDAKGLSHMGVKPGDKWLVDTGTANLMKNYTGLMNDDIRGVMIKSFDTVMKYWKGMQLMTLGYHARNVLGNMANRYVAGMPFREQVKYDTMAGKMLHSYEKNIMPKKMKGQKLSKAEKKTAKNVEDFLHTGLRGTNQIKGFFEDFDKTVDNMIGKDNSMQLTGNKAADKTFNTVKGGFDWAMDKNYKIGTSLDEAQRFGMYMWAKKQMQKPKPNGVQGVIMNLPEINNPVAAVKAAMFDYQNLTKFERDVMKRLMPFYTFTRNNLPFQLKNAALNPNRYDNINDFVQMTYDISGSDQENMPSYLKESMAFGVPGSPNTYAKTYLPQSDLANFAGGEESLEQITSLIAPHLKLPFENKVNYDFFREKQIQEFEGEKSDKYFGLVSPMAAHNLDQLGLRNIEKGLGAVGNGIQELQGNKVDGSALDKYFNSLFTDTDPSKSEQHKLYEQRQKLVDLKKVFEQETGQKLPSVRELEKQLKASTGKSNDLFSKYIGGE